MNLALNYKDLKREKLEDIEEKKKDYYSNLYSIQEFTDANKSYMGKNSPELTCYYECQKRFH